MKSIQTKGKTKKKNEKLGKIKLSTKDTNSIVNPDLSNLRKPIDTSVSDLCQVSKLLENGTDEVKSILSYECNIIYECRTCHSLFRSIVNLISHKREYCRKKFDITLHRSILHNYNHSSKESIIQMCKTDQTRIKESIKNDRILRSQVSKESHKKDLSTVIEMLNKKREESMDNNVSSELKNTIFHAPSNQHIYLESINTNHSAVYQTVKSSNTMIDTKDLMKEQVAKLHKTDQNTIILKGQTLENQLEKSDSPIQMDMSDEENELLAHRLPTNNLACTICNAKFSTKKTLTFHMKTLHTSKRICYPCPCCTSTFANTWSVYRHLYKVHRKTNEQVRKLRSHIQEKAFHRETTITEGLENVRATKTSVLENVTMKNNDKTQKSINHIESTAELQSCGRRKKRFKTRAVFSTPLQYFQIPIAACNETTTTIRQSNKTLADSNTMLCEKEDTDAATIIVEQSDIHSGCTLSSPEICEENETSIRVQRVSSLSKEVWDILQKDLNFPDKCNSVDNNNDLHKITPLIIQNVDNSKLQSSENENQDNSMSNTNLQSSEVVCTNISEINSVTTKIKNNKEKISGHQSDEIPLTELKKRDVIEVQEDNSKLQSSCSIQSNEKSQTLLMEKIATIANFQKLQCLLCKRKFTSMPNLRRHMATHIGWNRYRCKLCDFKCFVKCDCVAHCNKMHNAQNNRAVIAEIVIEIPQNEYTCNENIVMNVMNTEEKMNDPDIMDLTAFQSEKYVDLNNSDNYIAVQNETTTTIDEQQESSKNIEYQDIAEEEGDKTVTQNLAEYMMNSGSGKLDAHPDLKRMVMEVIFGSSDTSAIEQTDSDKSALKSDSDVRECINDNENSTASSDDVKEAPRSISEIPSTLDNLKNQRPIRNRMKPLSNDFVYDLKEITFRKECALFNDSATLHVRKKAKLYN
ncbi:zinc finger protein 800 [Cataglyphis hispanica]|uniref:zinc finger protein 800 n=1 Tax=Cataglyphis hispanica TaxID=1086592 RepID=UPI00217FB0AE|nr:zinc finger protein 800 [Cataglyphis hispanica]